MNWLLNFAIGANLLAFGIHMVANYRIYKLNKALDRLMIEMNNELTRLYNLQTLGRENEGPRLTLVHRDGQYPANRHSSD